MKIRLPAVVIAPPRLGVPVLRPFASSAWKEPSGTCQAMSPVFVLTATSSPHGGAWHEYIVSGSQKRRPSGVTLRHGRRRRRPFVVRTPLRRRGAALDRRSPTALRRWRAAPVGRSAAPAASGGHRLEVPPLPRVHHVGEHQAERLVHGHAVPVAAADRAREEHDVVLVVPRRVRDGVLQRVLVPQPLQ